MIGHCTRLMWNRKSSLLFIMLGIFLTFLVLIFSLSFFLYCYDNYRKPLGFDYNSVWALTIDPKNAPLEEIKQTMLQIEQVLTSFEGIRSFTYSGSLLLDAGMMVSTTVESLGNSFSTRLYIAGDNYPAVLKLALQSGRWFSAEDNGAQPEPVIINKKMAGLLGAGNDAIGHEFNSDDTVYRVIGVLDIFRYAGHFSADHEEMILRIGTADERSLKRIKFLEKFRLLIRTEPGQGGLFEEQLMKRLSLITEGWTLHLDSLEHLSEKADSFSLLIPYILGGICLFLIVNVALGLFGVIWYTTTMRTAEVGLRRAMGASTLRVAGQIITESLVLVSFAIVFGFIFSVQVPLLGFVEFIDAIMYLRAFLLSAVVLYSLTTLCALLPALRASTIEPATALHCE